MEDKNIFEKLQIINPDMEIWWDSFPVAYDRWNWEIITCYNQQNKNWTDFIGNFFNHTNPIIKGVTTNPSLVYQAIMLEPDYWRKFCQQNTAFADVEKKYSILYREVIKKGARYLLPLWENSSGKYGWVCAQIDPRSIFDEASMLEQAYEFAQLAKNIMIKIPGTNEGCKVVEKLTSEGISTNSTLNFTVSQIQACLEAVLNGEQKARQKNTSLLHWRSVITFMMGRYGAKGELFQQAQIKKIPLQEFDIRCAELAICKKAYQIVKQHSANSKLLLCSLKVDSDNTRFSHISYHIEQTTGANCIYACPPKYFESIMAYDQNFLLKDNMIGQPLSQTVFNKLNELTYFQKAYQANALSREEFNNHIAVRNSNQDVYNSHLKIMDFIHRNC